MELTHLFGILQVPTTLVEAKSQRSRASTQEGPIGSQPITVFSVCVCEAICTWKAAGSDAVINPCFARLCR
jgi:hypothetical protein